MYRLEQIIKAFRPVVGWQPGYTDKEKIAKDLTRSESGLFFQEANPLLTLRAMNAIRPETPETDYPEWSKILTYKRGKIVKHNGRAWELLVDEDKGTEPAFASFNEDFNNDFESNVWGEYTPLSSFLQKRVDSGIKNVVTRFMQEKVIGMETRSFIDRRTLFDGTGRVNERMAGTNSIVGFELLPVRSESVVMKLEKIGMQFTGNTGNVTIYIFHSSSPEPVFRKTFQYNKTNGTFMWFDLGEIYLPYRSDTTNSGGSWYVVYNQRELPAYMEAINYTRDWSKGPCPTCNRGDAQLFREMGKYVQISPFKVSVPEDWDGKLWDVQDMIYTNMHNYGLNLQFSIGCDLTPFFLENRLMFASAIQKQVAVNCLRELALNPEVSVNRVQSNAGRDDILYETEGNGQGIKGLSGELDRAYKALEFDTKGIDRICLSCHTGGIKFRSV